MYIILEGMPATGKTTISKKLAKILNAVYMKSVMSNTDYGRVIKEFRDIEDFSDLLYQSDLLLDELKVYSYLDKVNIVRDKTWTSTLAHLNTHGFKTSNDFIEKILLTGYNELINYYVQPDLVIYLTPNYNAIQSSASYKTDYSAIDDYLIKNIDLYKKQDFELKALINKYFNNVLILNSFQSNVDEMCDVIIRNLGSSFCE